MSKHLRILRSAGLVEEIGVDDSRLSGPVSSLRSKPRRATLRKEETLTDATDRVRVTMAVAVEPEIAFRVFHGGARPIVEAAERHADDVDSPRLQRDSARPAGASRRADVSISAQHGTVAESPAHCRGRTREPSVAV
jgi:hypothetical protein